MDLPVHVSLMWLLQSSMDWPVGYEDDQDASDTALTYALAKAKLGKKNTKFVRRNGSQKPKKK